MKNLKNIVLTFAILICMPLLSMQQPVQQWILKVQRPENVTPAQMAAQVYGALPNNPVRNWTRALGNEVWLGILGTRQEIINSLRDYPWFDANRLRPDRPLPPQEDLRPNMPQRYDFQK